MLAKDLGVDPEAALRGANHEFEQDVLGALRSEREAPLSEQGDERDPVERR
jgi:hypothetical protein